MMRAFHIVSIVFSILFGTISLYYAEETRSARWNDYDYYMGYSFESYGSSASDWTFEMSLISLGFFAFFVGVYVMSIVKIKTTTSKVLSIIGLSFTLIAMIWNSLMMTSPGGISFDEVVPAWLILALIYLGFSIPLLVNAVRTKS